MALTKISRGLLNTGVSDSSDATAITIDSSENVLIGTTSGSDPLVVSDSGASSITARFINTNADANPANIRLQKLSSSPADNDYIGMINVSGENDASEETIFQSIDFLSTDVSDGTEDGVIAFRTRGAGTLAERLRITESGFIKLSSQVAFTGQGDAGLGHHTNNYMYMYGGSAGLILQDNSGGSNRILIRDSNTIEFEVYGVEKMRIANTASYANLCIGRTGIIGDTSVGLHLTTGGWAIGEGTAGNTTAGSYRRAYFSSADDGLYYWNGTNQAYLTSAGVWSDASDEKLKKDIVDIPYGLDVVKSLKPRKYKMKANDLEQVGFIAQEVKDIIPEVAELTIVEHTDEENEEQYGLSYGHLTAVLTKAIQELSTKLEAAEARITTLEG